MRFILQHYKEVLSDKDGIINIYLNPFFVLHKVETYSQGSKLHKVGPIKVLFQASEELVVRIIFNKKDAILAWEVLEYLTLDSYGWDPQAEICLPLNKKIVQSELADFGIDQYYEIISYLKTLEDGKNNFFINYTNNEYGRNAFNYNKQCCIWIETEDTLEDGGYKKEVNRREQVQKGSIPETDEEAS